MAVDWSAIESEVVSECRAQLVAFSSRVSDGSFYGLILDCNATKDEEDFLISLNTEDVLTEVARESIAAFPRQYIGQTLEQARETKRWRAGDWKYRAIN